MPPRHHDDADDEDADDKEPEFDPGDDDEVEPSDNCPVCDAALDDCDHLVASIDHTFSEIASGTIFAHEREIFDLLEHLATRTPDELKAAGGGPALAQVASLVEGDMAEGMSTGDAVSNQYPALFEALRHILEEAGDVMVTETEVIDASGEDRTFSNVWSEDPQGVVDRLIERLEELSEATG